MSTLIRLHFIYLYIYAIPYIININRNIDGAWLQHFSRFSGAKKETSKAKNLDVIFESWWLSKIIMTLISQKLSYRPYIIRDLHYKVPIVYNIYFKFKIHFYFKNNYVMWLLWASLSLYFFIHTIILKSLKLICLELTLFCIIRIYA